MNDEEMALIWAKAELLDLENRSAKVRGWIELALTEIRLRASAENESAHSADPEPPTSQRTSQSEDRLNLVSVPRREWPAVSVQLEADGSYRPVYHGTEHHKPGPDDVGRQDPSAAHLPHSSPLDRMGAQQLLTPKLLISPDQQEAWEKST